MKISQILLLINLRSSSFFKLGYIHSSGNAVPVQCYFIIKIILIPAVLNSCKLQVTQDHFSFSSSFRARKADQFRN